MKKLILLLLLIPSLVFALPPAIVGLTSLGTNMLLIPNTLETSPWQIGNGSAATGAAAPDGSTNARTVTTTNNAHGVSQRITTVAGKQYTFTFYAKRGTMGDLKYSVYDWSNGADVVAATSYYAQTSSAWALITVTATAPVGCVDMGFYPLRDSGVTGTVLFWGSRVVQK